MHVSFYWSQMQENPILDLKGIGAPSQQMGDQDNQDRQCSNSVHPSRLQ